MLLVSLIPMGLTVMSILHAEAALAMAAVI